MNKFDLVLFIVSFFRNNKHVKNIDLGFKTPLILYSADNYDNELVIEKYYEYDVTISEYKNSKKINTYQECYDDLPITILEQIYEQLKIYSNQIKYEKTVS